MKSSPHLEEDADPGFQIAPMVDVVFVLLLFFMACAAMPERYIETKLPAHNPGGSTPEGVIELIVAADGSVVVNNQAMGAGTDHQLPGLTKWLRGVRDSFGDGDTLVIRPAPTVTHERVIQVLNATKAAGWQKLTFG